MLYFILLSHIVELLKFRFCIPYILICFQYKNILSWSVLFEIIHNKQMYMLLSVLLIFKLAKLYH